MNNEPLAYRVTDACRIAGIGTTKLYELIGARVLDARKLGSRTLIMGESLRNYVKELPKADILTGVKGGRV
jgi:hypothetical protein